MHRPLSVAEFNARFARMFPSGGIIVPQVLMEDPVSSLFKGTLCQFKYILPLAEFKFVYISI